MKKVKVVDRKDRKKHQDPQDGSCMENEGCPVRPEETEKKKKSSKKAKDGRRK